MNINVAKFRQGAKPIYTFKSEFDTNVTRWKPSIVWLEGECVSLSYLQDKKVSLASLPV